MTWLRDTPQAVVGAHLEMLGRLEAEERMAAGHAAAMSGVLAPRGERRVWDSWRRAAAPPVKARPASVQELAAIGVRVSFEPPRPAAPTAAPEVPRG